MKFNPTTCIDYELVTESYFNYWLDVVAYIYEYKNDITVYTFWVSKQSIIKINNFYLKFKNIKKVTKWLLTINISKDDLIRMGIS